MSKPCRSVHSVIVAISLVTFACTPPESSKELDTMGIGTAAMSTGGASTGPGTASGSIESSSGNTENGDPATGSDGTDTGVVTSSTTTGDTPPLDPPAHGSSMGMGGGAADGEFRQTDGIAYYYVIADGSPGPHPLIIVYSGIEGGETMTQNFRNAIAAYGYQHWIVAVIDGILFGNDGQAGADVLDHVRSQYDIDNDRTYLLGESAGTAGALQLGFQLRQSYFAAFWANDVSLLGAPPSPKESTETLGFRPFGNAGPGGNFPLAQQIVDAMADAGYRTPPPAPYDGPGAQTHGSNEQFQTAILWMEGKDRLE